MERACPWEASDAGVVLAGSGGTVYLTAQGVSWRGRGEPVLFEWRDIDGLRAGFPYVRPAIRRIRDISSWVGTQFLPPTEDSTYVELLPRGGSTWLTLEVEANDRRTFDWRLHVAADVAIEQATVNGHLHAIGSQIFWGAVEQEILSSVPRRTYWFGSLLWGFAESVGGIGVVRAVADESLGFP